MKEKSLLANRIEATISTAILTGWKLDDGNVIDLLADHIPERLDTLRATLAHTRFADRFQGAINYKGGKS